MFDFLIQVKLLLALIEEAVLRTIALNNTFDKILFSKIIKKISYDYLESEMKDENIEELTCNLRLNYDFEENPSCDDVLNEIEGLNEDETLEKLKEMGLINKIKLDFILNDDMTLDLDIPISSIIERIVEDKYIEKENISLLELKKDLNLIDEIWMNWDNSIKEYIDDLIKNIR
jgi:hypothetical protein